MRFVMPLVLVVAVLLSTYWLGHTVADGKHAKAVAAAQRAAARRYDAEQREGNKAVADLTSKFNALTDQYRSLETAATVPTALTWR